MADDQASPCRHKQARIDIRQVSSGQTRDCFYPWDTVFIHADRTVRVCCTSPIIETVSADWDLEKLANGEKFRQFRKDFLMGKLTPECDGCSIKTQIPLNAFKAKLREHLSRTKK